MLHDFGNREFFIAIDRIIEMTVFIFGMADLYDRYVARDALQFFGFDLRPCDDQPVYFLSTDRFDSFNLSCLVFIVPSSWVQNFRITTITNEQLVAKSAALG